MAVNQTGRLRAVTCAHVHCPKCRRGGPGLLLERKGIIIILMIINISVNAAELYLISAKSRKAKSG